MTDFGERLSRRQKDFKKGVNADDARRKREDATVQVRRQTRDEALQKKRMMNDLRQGRLLDEMVETGAGFDATAAQAGQAQMEMPARMDLGFPVDQVPAMLQMLIFDDPTAQLKSTQQFRKLLCIEQDAPIQEVIATGAVPRFVEFLKDIKRPDLQFEAAWVLTNIASGTAEQAQVVVEHGTLPIFVDLLNSPNDDIREEAVWALGNIAGDSPNLRDLILKSGGLNPVMKVLRESKTISMMRNATWTLFNLCRGKPPPPFEWVSPAIGTLAHLICSTDVEVIANACWALSYLAEGPNEHIQVVIDAGVCRRLVELLGHSSSPVQVAALRAVGNMSTGDDEQTQIIIQAGALPQLLKLLSHVKKAIRKESCWTISNISAGNRAQINEIITNGLIPPVINLLQTSDAQVRKEAAWAILQAASSGNPQQVEYLVMCGCIKPMVDLLGMADTLFISIALQAIEAILKVGQQKQQEQGLIENPFAALVEEVDGTTKIEALQKYPNADVYQKAMRIIDRYFSFDDDNAGIAENTEGNQSFGLPMPQGGFQFDEHLHKHGVACK